jgi:hypothetical protein
MTYYIDDTGAMAHEPKTGFYPVVEDPLPEITACELIEQGELVRHEDHWQRKWKVVPAPSYSAGEWLELVGLGAGQQPTLIYLKLQLAAAGKTSDKLTALEGYLNQVLGLYAADQVPRCDWQQPPVGYQETVAECVSILQGNG